MIRKLLSNRVLFTAGVVLTAWNWLWIAPKLPIQSEEDLVYALIGPSLIAYSLWGLVASLRREPVTLHDGQGSTDQARRRNA
jgi:hypothetical protein